MEGVSESANTTSGWSPLQQMSTLFGVALLLRVLAALRTPVIFNDGPSFIAIATAIGEGRLGEALAHPYHPLYPALLAALGRVVPDLEMAGIATSVVAGSAAVVALYCFLRAAFDARLAFVGAMLLALSPYAIRFSADVQSDSLYLALFLFGVAALYPALREASAARAFLTGALSGAAYLTRPEGLGVVIVGLVLAAFACVRGAWSLRRALRWSSALIAGLTALALPYLLAIRNSSGRWGVSQKKSILTLLGIDGELLARAAAGDPAALGMPVWALLAVVVLVAGALGIAFRRMGAEELQAVMRARIGARGRALGAGGLVGVAALSAPSDALRFWAVMVSTMRPEVVILLAAGIGSRLRRGPQGRGIFVSSFIALYAAVLFGLLVHYGYLSRRHALPPLTLLMGYAAIGLLVVEHFLRSLYQPPEGEAHRWGLGIPGILLVAVAAIGLPKALDDHRVEEIAGRTLAEWVRDQPSLPTGALASNKVKLGYYAGRPWHGLFVGGELQSAEALHARGVRLVIAEREVLTEGKILRAPLAPGSGSTLELAELHRVEVADHHAVLFELRARAY